jgi:hypothetical protein
MNLTTTQPNAEVKNEWRYTPISPRFFMACTWTTLPLIQKCLELKLCITWCNPKVPEI